MTTPIKWTSVTPTSQMDQANAEPHRQCHCWQSLLISSIPGLNEYYVVQLAFQIAMQCKIQCQNNVTILGSHSR